MKDKVAELTQLKIPFLAGDDQNLEGHRTLDRAGHLEHGGPEIDDGRRPALPNFTVAAERQRENEDLRKQNSELRLERDHLAERISLLLQDLRQITIQYPDARRGLSATTRQDLEAQGVILWEPGGPFSAKDS
jgi:hypothetical protein